MEEKRYIKDLVKKLADDYKIIDYEAKLLVNWILNYITTETFENKNELHYYGYFDTSIEQRSNGYVVVLHKNKKYKRKKG